MTFYFLLPARQVCLFLCLFLPADALYCCTRFHAWQSALLFTVALVLHLVLSWSRVLSWLLFFGDLVAIAALTLRAYRDADTLDRYDTV